MKHTFQLFAFLVFISSCKQAVKEQAEAQDTVQVQPSIFEEGRISNNGVFGLTLSPEADRALWVSSNGSRDTLFIMEAVYARDLWQKPVTASFSTNTGAWKDIDPMFSPDGKKVLFQSNRPVEGYPNRKGFDIWAVDKTETGWSEAYNLGPIINSDSSESFASMTKSGNIYFMKNDDKGLNDSDLYVSKWVNGAYQAPENLGLPINTAYRESNPYISPDEDYIVYFSTDSTGFGEVDLYISFRVNNVWKSPINLGKDINSASSEFCPFVHQGQKKIYFARQDEGNDRFIENIYSAPFDVEKYRKMLK